MIKSLTSFKSLVDIFTNFNTAINQSVHNVTLFSKQFFSDHEENFKNFFIGCSIGSLTGIVLSLQRDNINALISKKNNLPINMVNQNSLLKIATACAILFGIVFFLGTKKNDKKDKAKIIEDLTSNTSSISILNDELEEVTFSDETKRFEALMKAIKERNLKLVKKIVKKPDDLGNKNALYATWHSYYHSKKIKAYLYKIFYSKC